MKNSDDINSLEYRLSRGLQFADNLSMINQQELQGNQVLLHTLLEVLVAKGLVRFDEIEERKAQIQNYFTNKQPEKPQIRLSDSPDKYTYQSDFTIDCAQLIHLCKGTCCRLWFALSAQDLDEGIVRWDYGNPYSIAHNKAGYCVHNDCENSCKCTIYVHRPFVCRSYDCRKDTRIWLDFENKIPNPNLSAQIEP